MLLQQNALIGVILIKCTFAFFYKLFTMLKNDQLENMYTDLQWQWQFRAFVLVIKKCIDCIKWIGFIYI